MDIVSIRQSLLLNFGKDETSGYLYFGSGEDRSFNDFLDRLDALAWWVLEGGDLKLFFDSPETTAKSMSDPE